MITRITFKLGSGTFKHYVHYKKLLYIYSLLPPAFPLVCGYINWRGGGDCVFPKLSSRGALNQNKSLHYSIIYNIQYFYQACNKFQLSIVNRCHSSLYNEAIRKDMHLHKICFLLTSEPLKRLRF